MLEILPDLLGHLGDPAIEELLHEIVVTADVDRGQGSFESLSNPVVGEHVFGTDPSLQLPVAATVLELNLMGFIQRLVNV